MGLGSVASFRDRNLIYSPVTGRIAMAESALRAE
jgi:hypothetical protein